MSEPRLETIEDYHSLKGEKRKIVWRVILISLIVGAIFVAASSIYGKSDDAIQIEERIKTIPLR